MTVGQQRRTIAVSAMVVFTLGFLNAAQNDEVPDARFLIGVGFTYTFISIFADLGAGDIAAAFAILILLTAVIYEGEDIMNYLTKRANSGRKKHKRHPSTGVEGLEPIEGTDTEFEKAQRPGRVQRATRMIRSTRLSRR